MGALENLQRLYEKKQGEVRLLEIRLKEASAYLQAIQDSLRVIASDTVTAGETAETEQVLRAGSVTAQARDVLRLAGKPLHISELLQQLGRPSDKKSRASLSSSIAAYVRTGQIFTRPAPNTFGLVEFGKEQTTAENKLPDSFGSM